LSQPSWTVTKALTPRARIELVLDRERGVDDARATSGLLQQSRQAVVVLRADDQIDRGLAAQYLGALGLRDAAGDDDRRGARLPRPRLLDLSDLAEFGIDFFRSALPDVAGVQHDEVGLGDIRGLQVALPGRQIGDPPGIVDVHLATEGLHEDASARFRSPRRNGRIVRDGRLDRLLPGATGYRGQKGSLRIAAGVYDVSTPAKIAEISRSAPSRAVEASPRTACSVRRATSLRSELRKNGIGAPQ
jgi:hypothetical protein